MLARRNFYKTHKNCHIYEELKKRSKSAKGRIDGLFKLLAKSSTSNEESSFGSYSFGSVSLHNDFDKALICYGMKIDSYCLIEIYSVLEARLIIRLREEFGKVKVSRKLTNFLKSNAHLFELEYFLRRFKASEIANILKSIGVITKEHYKFVCELERLRDAIVHRNLSRLGKFNKRSKKVHIHSQDTSMVKFDTEKYFIGAIRFEWALLNKRKKEKYVRSEKKLLTSSKTSN